MTLTARASRAVRSVEPVTDAAIAVANPCQIRISSLNLLDFNPYFDDGGALSGSAWGGTAHSFGANHISEDCFNG